MKKGVEVTGRIEEMKTLILDEPIPYSGKVRVILFAEDDISEEEWLKACSQNTAFEDLNHPDEDIYTLEDGEPFDPER